MLQIFPHTLMPPLPRILLGVCAFAVAAVAAASALSDSNSGGRCDQWSAWEARQWGGLRRRESCSDGRIEEQCRSGGIVTACHVSSRSAPGGVGVGDLASAPQFNARRPVEKNFVYYSYYYDPYYSYYYYAYTYTYVAWYCSIGCIAGAAIGGLTGLGLLIGGGVALFCICYLKKVRVVRPNMATTTTTVMAAPSTVAVYPNTGTVAYSNQGYSGGGDYQGTYPSAYPATNPTTYPTIYPSTYPPAYPPTYPATTQASQGATTAYLPPYPAQQAPPSYQ